MLVSDVMKVIGSDESRTLAATKSSSSSMFISLRMSLLTALACLIASTILPVPASPFVLSIAAPSAIRRRASPRFLQPHTNGTLKLFLLM